VEPGRRKLSSEKPNVSVSPYIDFLKCCSQVWSFRCDTQKSDRISGTSEQPSRTFLRVLLISSHLDLIHTREIFLFVFCEWVFSVTDMILFPLFLYA
jgi:hypothetical protein